MCGSSFAVRCSHQGGIESATHTPNSRETDNSNGKRVRRGQQMTEAEWLQMATLFPMLETLRDKGATERKLRLFACACVRHITHLLPSDLCRSAIDVAEQYADGEVSADTLRDASFEAEYSRTTEGYRHSVMVSELARSAVGQLTGHFDDPWETVSGATSYPCEAVGGRPSSSDEMEEQTQCSLLRDIFGNPFRPITLDPSWLTSTVLALATGIYNEKAFDKMPILADALQDAGCDNAEILNHCRQPGEHVRGCWVVDLLLSKQ